MKTPIFAKVALALAGLIATSIGLAILFVPHAFHGSVGIVLDDDLNLLNEIKAPAGMVLTCGLFAFAGLFRPSMATPALIVSAVMYLSFGLSRLLSLVIDGVPGDALVQSMAIEFALAALCAAALGRLPETRKQAVLS